LKLDVWPAGGCIPGVVARSIVLVVAYLGVEHCGDCGHELNYSVNTGVFPL
jgi:hypothetical protein